VRARFAAFAAGALVWAAFAVGLAAFAVPGTAAAAPPPNPLSPGLPVPTGPAPPTTTTPAPVPSQSNPSSPGGSGLSGATAVVISLGAIALIAGIAFFIWHDARRRAPVRHAHATAESGRSGSKRPINPRKLSPAERRRRKRGRAR
jgi:hypothetical protein